MKLLFTAIALLAFAPRPIATHYKPVPKPSTTTLAATSSLEPDSTDDDDDGDDEPCLIKHV